MEIVNALKERTEDSRDFSLGAFIELPKLEELPEEYFVKPLSIKDQGGDGNKDFCASCAGAGMREPKEEVILFYPFLFAAAKFESGAQPNTWGLELRDIGKALVKHGVPELKDVPHEIVEMTVPARRDFKNYPESVREAAKKHIGESYAFLSGPYDAYDNARAYLWKFRHLKQQLIMGTMFGWNSHDFELKGTPDGGGHAMWVSGWYTDGLEIVNSYGLKAGKAGKHKMSRETFNNAVKRFGALSVVDMPRDDIEYMLDNGIKHWDNWLKAFFKVLLSIFKSKKLTNKQKVDIINNASDTLDIIKEKMTPETNSDKLFKLAVAKLGIDASPKDVVNDDLACAESVCTILKELIPELPMMPGTWTLWNYLNTNPGKFKKISDPKKGAIIISPTGMGNNIIPNGHTGICGEDKKIMSNDSKTGKWLENYNELSWTVRYVRNGSYPVYYFEVI